MDIHDGFFGCSSDTPASGMPVNVDDEPQADGASGSLGILPGVSDVYLEVAQPEGLGYSAEATCEAGDEALGDDLRGYRKRWACKRKMTAETEYSPSVLPDAFPPEPPKAGLAKVSSSSDDAAAFVNSFIDRMSPSQIVMLGRMISWRQFLATKLQVRSCPCLHSGVTRLWTLETCNA